VRRVGTRYAVDPAAVYVAGMSAGGAMAWVLATVYPELFCAAGLHSALPYASANDAGSAFDAMRNGASSASAMAHACPVPVIAFQGDADDLVHPENAQAIVRQRLAAHASSPLRPVIEQATPAGSRSYQVVRHRDAEGRTAAELWLVHGLGHAWSGGSAGGSHTDPHGPDASARMMAFFREQQGRKR
jgi:poly(3-hydroxybutyrate) depolymerase